MVNYQIANSARVFGKVRLGNHSVIAQGVTIRSMEDSVIIGNDSMVLENSTLIGSKKHPITVGSKTIFGHKCLVLGAEIGNLCEIGNGTIFMPGCKIGNMCVFGEGTIIPEGMIIPDESVVLGRPGKIIRKLTSHDRENIIKLRANDISLSPYVENIIHNKEEGETMGILYDYKNKSPIVSDSAYLYDTAEITGDVQIGEHSIIGAGVKIIGDSHGPVRIGNNVQILENCVLHLLPDNELIIKDNVVIGPGSIIHGTTIGEGSIIESGVILCDNSSLGKNCLVKSGSLVKQRSHFDDNTILEGFPAKEIGEFDRKLERPSWIIQS